MAIRQSSPRPQASSPKPDDGFTLLEVVVAIVVLATAAVAAAGLFAMAAQSVRAARVQTWTVLLAADKLEQLRSLVWTYDAGGGALTDAAGLRASPGDSPERDVSGCVDYLDGSGSRVGDDAGPPMRAVYVRRWNIQPLPDDPADTLVLQVSVTPVAQWRRTAPGAGAADARATGGARLTSLRTRKGQE